MIEKLTKIIRYRRPNGNPQPPVESLPPQIPLQQAILGQAFWETISKFGAKFQKADEVNSNFTQVVKERKLTSVKPI